jgi:polysaccharide export outer membrane protein
VDQQRPISARRTGVVGASFAITLGTFTLRLAPPKNSHHVIRNMRLYHVFIMVATIAGMALWGGQVTALAAQQVVDPQKKAPYILQPADELIIHSLQVKELADKTVRLDQEGRINLPLIGRIDLSGVTLPKAEEILIGELKTFYVDPDVELNLTTQHTDSVSVIGAVGTPGVHQMTERTLLLDALSSAGGVRPDAGPVVLVTREASFGPIPNASARVAPSGESVVEIDLKSLLDARDPSENIRVRPHDVISIPPAQVVYVVGNVKRAGGFPLSGKSNLSVLQAIALAEGLDPRAAPERARILRRGTGAEQQIEVNIKKILKGTAEDITLRPNDILFVPNSASKTITSRSIEAAIQIGTGVAIFAR